LLQKIVSLVDRAEVKDYVDLLLALQKFSPGPQELRALVREASDRIGGWDVELYFSSTLRSTTWLDDFQKIKWVIKIEPETLRELAQQLANAKVS